MSNNNKFKKEQYELQQKEQKKNPTGILNDSINQNDSNSRLNGDMSYKEIGVIILFLVVIFVGYAIFKLFM